MILVISNGADPTTDRVVEYLAKRTAPIVRLNTEEVPEQVGVSLHFQDDAYAHTLVIDGVRVPLEHINAVWLRRPWAPEASSTLREDDREFAARESAHVLRGIWHLLKDRFWVNPRTAEMSAEHKPYQLALAAEIGFDVPRTLITNSPAEALQFFGRCNGRMIFKASVSYHHEGNGPPQSGSPRTTVFTNVVTRDDLLKRGDSIRHAPCIFQEYVPKASELTVTVVGDKMFAAEILSQRSERSKDDWRRYDLVNTPYRPYELPVRLRDLITTLMARLGLVFGRLDLVLTPDGRAVFLEVNPNGQWMWIQTLTGMPIAEAIGDLLLRAENSSLGASLWPDERIHILCAKAQLDRSVRPELTEPEGKCAKQTIHAKHRRDLLL